MDYLSLGPVPSEESCEQVGTPAYSPTRARRECRRFVELLRKTFGPEPEGARFRITSNPHDFGNYFDVIIEYDSNNREAVKYAFRAEDDTPSRWED